MFVGVASALLVIPAVRGVAVGILASSAVIGLILGFAAQRTIGNFIAGLLIAFTQPVRLGDEIEFDATRGVVEEVGLIYTWVRTPDSDRLVIPNEKLVSETLKNATIRNERPVAEVTVQLPLSADLRAAVAALEPDAHEVVVTELGDHATIAVRRFVERAASRSSRLRASSGSRWRSGSARQGSWRAASKIRHGPRRRDRPVPRAALQPQAEAAEAAAPPPPDRAS